MDNRTPICVKCECRFKPEKNGVLVKVLKGGGAFYYMIKADKLKCPKCGVEIVSGFAPKAMFYDFEVAANDTLKYQMEDMEKNEEVINDFPERMF